MLIVTHDDLSSFCCSMVLSRRSFIISSVPAGTSIMPLHFSSACLGPNEIYIRNVPYTCYVIWEETKQRYHRFDDFLATIPSIRPFVRLGRCSSASCITRRRKSNQYRNHQRKFKTQNK